MSDTIDYEKRLKNVIRRTVISVVAYLVFAIGGVVVIVTGNHDATKFLMIPLVAAVLILPRFPLPIDFDGKVPVAQKEAAEALLNFRRWITYTRGAYLIVALLILFGLPELVG
jgi:hypothetical protein